jgi:hypothetical protein
MYKLSLNFFIRQLIVLCTFLIVMKGRLRLFRFFDSLDFSPSHDVNCYYHDKASNERHPARAFVVSHKDAENLTDDRLHQQAIHDKNLRVIKERKYVPMNTPEAADYSVADEANSCVFLLNEAKDSIVACVEFRALNVDRQECSGAEDDQGSKEDNDLEVHPCFDVLSTGEVDKPHHIDWQHSKVRSHLNRLAILSCIRVRNHHGNT